MILLSICIPNYNRADFLWKSLVAIAPQVNDDIEIIISDDASKENISSIIHRFRKQYPQITLIYKRQSNNLGHDRNVLATVELARGKFCWLISNDDLILPGSLQRLLKAIHHRPQLALICVNYSMFDHLTKKLTASAMIGLDSDKYFNNANKFFFYPNKGYFPYLGTNSITLSTNIFNRLYWNEARKRLPATDFLGHNFIHLFLISHVIKNHPEIYYLSRPQIQYLANNQRIWPNKIWVSHNTVFLDLLLRLNYNRLLVEKMRRQYHIFKLKESLIRIKPIFLLYRQIHKLIGKFK